MLSVLCAKLSQLRDEEKLEHMFPSQVEDKGTDAEISEIIIYMHTLEQLCHITASNSNGGPSWKCMPLVS